MTQADRTRVDVRTRAAGLKVPVLAYLASRVAVLVTMWFAARTQDGNVTDIPKHWDGGWYLQMLQHGYPHRLPIGPDGRVGQNTSAFFPLFPMAARALTHLPTMGPVAAAAGLSLLCGLVATVLVWQLGRDVWDLDTANRAALVFAFFPGSFVFSLAYSEGLMLALAATALLLLHRRMWVLAGLAAALATATRPNALALCLAAAAAAFVAVRARREWRSLWSVALSPLGFIGFQVFLHHQTGSWSAWSDTQSQGWGERIKPLALLDLIQAFDRQPFDNVNETVALAGTVVAIIGLVLLVRARPPLELIAFTLGILALALTSHTLGARPRFVLTAFPLAYGVARALRRENLAYVLSGEAVLLGALSLVSMSTILATP